MNHVSIMHCDVPEGMSLREYRNVIDPPRRPSLFMRILRAVSR